MLQHLKKIWNNNQESACCQEWKPATPTPVALAHRVPSTWSNGWFELGTLGCLAQHAIELVSFHWTCRRQNTHLVPINIWFHAVSLQNSKPTTSSINTLQIAKFKYRSSSRKTHSLTTKANKRNMYWKSVIELLTTCMPIMMHNNAKRLMPVKAPRSFANWVMVPDPSAINASGPASQTKCEPPKGVEPVAWALKGIKQRRRKPCLVLLLISGFLSSVWLLCTKMRLQRAHVLDFRKSHLDIVVGNSAFIRFGVDKNCFTLKACENVMTLIGLTRLLKQILITGFKHFISCHLLIIHPIWRTTWAPFPVLCLKSCLADSTGEGNQLQGPLQSFLAARLEPWTGMGKHRFLLVLGNRITKPTPPLEKSNPQFLAKTNILYKLQVVGFHLTKSLPKYSGGKAFDKMPPWKPQCVSVCYNQWKTMFFKGFISHLKFLIKTYHYLNFFGQSSMELFPGHDATEIWLLHWHLQSMSIQPTFQ